MESPCACRAAVDSFFRLANFLFFPTAVMFRRHDDCHRTNFLAATFTRTAYKMIHPPPSSAKWSGKKISAFLNDSSYQLAHNLYNEELFLPFRRGQYKVLAAIHFDYIFCILDVACSSYNALQRICKYNLQNEVLFILIEEVNLFNKNIALNLKNLCEEAINNRLFICQFFFKKKFI